MNNYIGIDISKASLQVYIPKNDLDIEIDNTQQGLKKLTATLKKIYGETAKELIWIYEPTIKGDRLLLNYILLHFPK